MSLVHIITFSNFCVSRHQTSTPATNTLIHVAIEPLFHKAYEASDVIVIFQSKRRHIFISNEMIDAF